MSNVDVFGRRGADGFDNAVLEQQIADLVELLARVDDACPPNEKPRHVVSPCPPASKYKTAMRTATPFVTCSRMRE